MDRKTLRAQAEKLQTKCQQHRQYLHQCAEVGFDLPQTRAYITDTLKALGLTPQKVGKGGITAEIGQGKRTFLLRADMDALPGNEKTGLPFACKLGAMHACGHDMHTAILLGTAELLKAYEDKLNVKVKLLFQPAEEVLLGAKDCVENGVADGVDCAMMLHVLTGLPMPAGTVIISEGESAPSADFFTLTVHGKACHGGAPQNGVDAIAVGARIVLGMEEIIAKEVPQTAHAVLTVGKFIGGKAGNAIADSVTIEGTLRGFGENTRALIKRRLEEMAKGIAKAFRARTKLTFTGGCPTLINDRDRFVFTQKALWQVFDEKQVLLSSQLAGVRERSGGSEDFAYIAQEVPSVMIGLCAGNTKDGYEYPLHHPKADFDETALWQGVLAFAVCALTE